MNAYARTYDPHTSYFSPLNSEEYRIQMSLNYEGIGASLQLIDNYVTVMNVIQGGPAAVSGTLKPNDRITGVGEGPSGPITDVVGWRLDDVVQLIRGKAGTAVRLQVLPPGAAPGSKEKVLEFVRNKVTLKAQEAQSKLQTVTDQRPHLQDRRHHGAELLRGHRRGEPPAIRTIAAPRATCCGCSRSSRPGTSTAWCSTCATTAAAICPRRPRSRASSSRTARSCSCATAAATSRCWTIPSRRPPTPVRSPCWSTAYSASASEIFAGRDPGLSPRPHHRPEHLRQGHGAEPGAARPLERQADRGPAHGHHRQVLPRHRREHAAPRRDARRVAALAHRPEGGRRGRPAGLAAVGPHLGRALQDQHRDVGRALDRPARQRGGGAGAA